MKNLIIILFLTNLKIGFTQVNTILNCSMCDSTLKFRPLSNKTSIKFVNCYFPNQQLCSRTKRIQKLKKMPGSGEKWAWALKSRKSKIIFFDNNGNIVRKVISNK